MVVMIIVMMMMMMMMMIRRIVIWEEGEQQLRVLATSWCRQNCLRQGIPPFYFISLSGWWPWWPRWPWWPWWQWLSWWSGWFFFQWIPFYIFVTSSPVYIFSQKQPIRTFWGHENLFSPKKDPITPHPHHGTDHSHRTELILWRGTLTSCLELFFSVQHSISRKRSEFKMMMMMVAINIQQDPLVPCGKL